MVLLACQKPSVLIFETLNYRLKSINDLASLIMFSLLLNILNVIYINWYLVVEVTIVMISTALGIFWGTLIEQFMVYQVLVLHVVRFSHITYYFNLNGLSCPNYVVHFFHYLEFSNFIIIIICLIQVLEKYQVYGDSVLLQYGFRPTVRDIVKVWTNK